MKNKAKSIAFICSMALLVSILIPSVIMKVRASEPITMTIPITFIESVELAGEGIVMEREVSVLDPVQSDDGEVIGGTINLAEENITYADDMTTYNVVAWYTMNENQGYTQLSTTVSLDDISTIDEAGARNISIFAVLGKSFVIDFNNNKVNYGGYSYNDNVVVSKYYPQSADGESSKTVTLPTNPESELGQEFMIDGYVFKGWGERESGETEMITNPTITYPTDDRTGSTRYYAYWQEIMASGNIMEAGEYSLGPNTAYTFGEGTWKVNSDTSEYAGGNVFYVKTAGTYTFSK